MSAVFESQVKYFREKYAEARSKIEADKIIGFSKMNGYKTDDSLKEGLLSNDAKFRKTMFSYSGSLMPGHVSPATYAAVISVLADKFGVEYKTMTGFCLVKGSKDYAKKVEQFNQKKAQTGDEHPVYATHVYVVINGKDYEYLNGETTGIDHIDVIEL
jgi:hypothetical protein